MRLYIVGATWGETVAEIPRSIFGEKQSPVTFHPPGLDRKSDMSKKEQAEDTRLSGKIG